MTEYQPNKRANNPDYLLFHINVLLDIAKEYKNSSTVIYACLDARILLEYTDLNLILSSVQPEERQEVIESSKPKNGIDKLNNKRKTLKEKYQLFFQNLSELLGETCIYYDFKKSKDLQHRLSTYIHSYYMLESEINFESQLMQAAFPLIEEVQTFIESSWSFNGSEYQILGIEIETMPEEYLKVLEEWKVSKITIDELRERLTRIIASPS
tara:strand:- start:2695 stop:3327 length:633 start_codon:yes stop_codon:yes gene_type:complete